MNRTPTSREPARRYRIEWIPRRSWQQGVEPADQRWTVSPNVFTGTEVEMTREISELEMAHDQAVVFRAVPVETDLLEAS